MATAVLFQFEVRKSALHMEEMYMIFPAVVKELGAIKPDSLRSSKFYNGIAA